MLVIIEHTLPSGGNISELLKHELFPVSLSIPDTSGPLLSAADESDLQNIPEEEVCMETLLPK